MTDSTAKIRKTEEKSAVEKANNGRVFPLLGRGTLPIIQNDK